MQSGVQQLWSFVDGQRWLSPSELLSRVSAAASSHDVNDFDYRSRLLVRDALNAIAEHYGRSYVESRVSRAPSATVLRETWAAQFDDDTGFPSLRERLMEPISPDAIIRYLRDLGRDIREPTSITIGGSVALIMRDLLIRRTEDIEVVNDIPRSIREMHRELAQLRERHELLLGHFASHYLPEGWEQRTSSLERFDQLDVRLVDAIDVLVAKLFSLRSKDFVDLRSTWNLIDHEVFRNRLSRYTRGVRAFDYLVEPSKRNWYTLTGESELPPIEKT